MTPVTSPGASPVMVVPLLTPTSPVTAVAPVLVMALPASTAKSPAAPRFTDAGFTSMVNTWETVVALPAASRTGPARVRSSTFCAGVIGAFS